MSDRVVILKEKDIKYFEELFDLLDEFDCRDEVKSKIVYTLEYILGTNAVEYDTRIAEDPELGDYYKIVTNPGIIVNTDPGVMINTENPYIIKTNTYKYNTDDMHG